MFDAITITPPHFSFHHGQGVSEHGEICPHHEEKSITRIGFDLGADNTSNQPRSLS